MGAFKLHISDIEEMAYQFATTVDLIPCYYCGLIATGIDHVVPRKVWDMVRVLDDKTITEIIKRDHRVLEVDCCGECNSLLGASYQNSLKERKQELKKRLRKRYRKILETPMWEDEELESLGYSLRSYIIRCLRAKELVLKRLGW